MSSTQGAAYVRDWLNVEDGATKNDSDADLRDRATHTGSQAMSTVTRLVTALFDRHDLPGQTPEAFAATLAGEGSGKSPYSVSDVSEIAGLGNCIVLSAARLLAARGAFALGADVLQVEARLKRTTDATDPTGDAVVLGVGWLAADKTLISKTIVASESDLVVADGAVVLRGRVGRTDLSGVVQAPASAVYAVPYVETFGGDGETVVQILRAELVTDIDSAERELDALQAAAGLGYPVYDSIAEGLAATSDGGGFSVASGDSLVMYRNDGGAEVEVASLPLTTTTTALGARIDVLDARTEVIEGVNAGPRLDALEASQTTGQIVTATWSELDAIMGDTEGAGGEVLDSDTGTHTDPVVGGTVDNAGRYSWSDSPAGWKRIGDTGLTGVQASVDHLSGQLPTLLEPGVLAYDSFNRANGAIGASESGQVWEVADGTAEIVANEVKNTGGTTTLRVLMDLEQVDRDVTFGVKRADVTLQLFPLYVSEAARCLVYFTATELVYVSSHAATTTYTNLPPDYDETLPFDVRIEVIDNLLKVYLTTAAHTDFLVAKRQFEDAEIAAFGAATKTGFYIRSHSAITKFIARQPDQRRVHIDTLQEVAATSSTHDALMREAAEIAAREADAAVSIEVLDPVADLGFPDPGTASDKFRGWINLPGGGGLLLARSSGYFVVRRPDGSMFTTTLGIPPADFGTTEWNMSGPFIAGPYIVFPPRDSNFVGVVEWRKLFNESRVDEAGYALTKYTFGLDWGSLRQSVDKFTGGIFVFDRYAVFWPTDAGAYFIWDIVTGEARFETFGLNLYTGVGGKKYIGGVQGFSGDLWQVPFNADHIVRVNILTGYASYVETDIDLVTGENQWSGITPAVDYGLWCAPRGSTQGILHIDEFNTSDPISLIAADEDGNAVDWGASITTNRFITCPNFHLLGGKVGTTGKLVYVDPLARSFRVTDFGYEVANGATIPASAREQIGGIGYMAGSAGRVDFAPSSAPDFLRANITLSQPTPTHLLLDPAINKGT